MAQKPTKAQLAAWREARVQHYIATRGVDSLARMIVDLEDSGGNVPEFDIDDDWPECVRNLRHAGGGR
jgi:hypothetical protein